MILAGDIGGTKTILALFEETDEGLRLVRDATYPSKQHGSLEDILKKFLQEEPLRVACFGVAGPVIGGRVQTTNLPWRLDERILGDLIGTPGTKLLNDLEAAAIGMLHLDAEDLLVLNKGEKREGNVAVIAAGTGLGEAMLIWDGKEHVPVASEGGHADFGPTNDEQVELLVHLREKYGHVSYERVLSGPGLFDIYCFLRDAGFANEPDWLGEKLREGDPSAVITRLGAAGEHPLCARSVEMFTSIYGAEAGNLALKCVASGGVFVGGGIAPRLLSVLRAGLFMEAFTDKGRFSGLMKSMPVRVALNPRAPLVGAAYFATRL